MLRAALVYDPYRGLNSVELVKSLAQSKKKNQQIPQLKYRLQQALVSVVNTGRREGGREGGNREEMGWRKTNGERHEQKLIWTFLST